MYKVGVEIMDFWDFFIWRASSEKAKVNPLSPNAAKWSNTLKQFETVIKFPFSTILFGRASKLPVVKDLHRGKREYYPTRYIISLESHLFLLLRHVSGCTEFWRHADMVKKILVMLTSAIRSDIVRRGKVYTNLT